MSRGMIEEEVRGAFCCETKYRYSRCKYQSGQEDCVYSSMRVKKGVVHSFLIFFKPPPLYSPRSFQLIGKYEIQNGFRVRPS